MCGTQYKEIGNVPNFLLAAIKFYNENYNSQTPPNGTASGNIEG